MTSCVRSRESASPVSTGARWLRGSGSAPHTAVRLCARGGQGQSQPRLRPAHRHHSRRAGGVRSDPQPLAFAPRLDELDPLQQHRRMGHRLPRPRRAHGVHPGRQQPQSRLLRGRVRRRQRPAARRWQLRLHDPVHEKRAPRVRALLVADGLHAGVRRAGAEHPGQVPGRVIHPRPGDREGRIGNDLRPGRSPEVRANRQLAPRSEEFVQSSVPRLRAEKESARGDVRAAEDSPDDPTVIGGDL